MVGEPLLLQLAEPAAVRGRPPGAVPRPAHHAGAGGLLLRRASAGAHPADAGAQHRQLGTSHGIFMTSRDRRMRVHRFPLNKEDYTEMALR